MTQAQQNDGAELYAEFSKRFQKLRDEGLVDFKMKVFSGRDTSVDGVVMTLNNVLRLRDEGQLIPIDIA